MNVGDFVELKVQVEAEEGERVPLKSGGFLVGPIIVAEVGDMAQLMSVGDRCKVLVHQRRHKPLIEVARTCLEEVPTERI